MSHFNDKKSAALKIKLKELVLDWAAESTSHAFPNIFRSKQLYLKIMWSILFLSGIAGFGYILINYLITYFSWGVNVDIGIYTESPANFPAVTICNLNPFYKQRVENYANMVTFENNLTNFSQSKAIPSGYTALQISKYAVQLIQASIISNQSLSDEEKGYFSFDINELLISCYFKGAACDSSYFYRFYDFNYGNCYTFNSGKASNGSATPILQISDAGQSSSLELELFVGDPSRDEIYVYRRGAYVVVHNQSVTPIMDSEGIVVSTGFETFIGVKRTFINNLPSPFSPGCTSDLTSASSYNSDLYREIFNTLNQTTYRQVYCYKLCYQETVIERCNCSDPSLPITTTKTYNITIIPCRSAIQLVCVSSAKTAFQSSPISDKCASSCPLECTTISYETTQSMASYPTDYYSDILKTQSNLKPKFLSNSSLNTYLTNSILKLNVFYTNTQYTNITQVQATTWDVLLGNIGGMMGLLMVISVLSLAELLEILFETIRLTYTHLKPMTKINEINSKSNSGI